MTVHIDELVSEVVVHPDPVGTQAMSPMGGGTVEDVDLITMLRRREEIARRTACEGFGD